MTSPFGDMEGELQRLASDLGLDVAEIAGRRDRFGLGEAEERVLQALDQPLGRVRDGFIRGFYDFLGRFEETAVLLESPGTVERLARSQAAYFKRLTQGSYDLDYALDRLRVGVAHERVGLGPRWYLGGFNRYLSALVPALASATDGPSGWVEAVRALARIVLLDVSLALEAYQLGRRRTLAAGDGAEPALDATAGSTPSVPIEQAEVSDAIRLMGLTRGEMARRRAFLGLAGGGSSKEERRLRDRVAEGIRLDRGGGSLQGLLAAQCRRLCGLAGTCVETAGGDLNRAAMTFTAAQREVFFDIGLIVDGVSHAAERPLQEAREAARAVTRSLPSGLLTLGADLRVQAANPRACGILGRGETELIGLPLSAALHAPLLVERAEQCVRDSEPRSDLFVDISGPPRQLLRVAISPLAGQRPSELRLLVSLDDVTGVTQLQEEVARSEQRFRTLVEGLDVAVCEARPAPLTMTFVSPQVERILGLQPEAWLASTDAWLDRIHPDDRPAVEAELDRLAAGEVDATGSMTYRFDTGERGEIWVQHRSQLTVDATGRRVIRAVLLDITSIKQVELELLSERNFVRSLLDTAGAVVLVMDLEGRIVEFNAAAEALYGRSREEVTGQDYVQALLPESERAGVAQELERLRSGGRTRGYENQILTRSGLPRTVLWNADALLSDDGENTGVVAVGVDVTERLEAEAELRQAHDELLRAHRSIASERSKVARAERLSSIGLLAAGVAHEINNPLGGVIACVEALQRGTLPPDRAKEYFIAVGDGLDRIRSTVGGLLDYAKQRPPSPEPLNLASLVDSCVRLAAPAVRASGIRIEQRIERDAPVAYADRPQVMQAVLNILLNAIHAVGDEGVIRALSPTRADQVGIRIQDDGPGIPAAIVDRVCDPFFTTNAEGAGTGLGLAVTLGLAEANGGELEIRSSEGEGASVTVWLPVAAR